MQYRIVETSLDLNNYVDWTHEREWRIDRDLPLSDNNEFWFPVVEKTEYIKILLDYAPWITKYYVIEDKKYEDLTYDPARIEKYNQFIKERISQLSNNFKI